MGITLWFDSQPSLNEFSHVLVVAIDLLEDKCGKEKISAHSYDALVEYVIGPNEVLYIRLSVPIVETFYLLKLIIFNL